MNFIEVADGFRRIMKFISKLPVEFITTILIATSLISVFLTLTKNYWLVRLGMDDFVLQHKVWIGLTFLLSASLLLSILAVYIFQSARKSFIAAQKFKEQHKYQVKLIEDLSLEEQIILFRYLMLKTKTQYFDVTNGIVAGLEKKGVIYLATPMGYPRSSAFNVAPWVWDLMKENPEKLISDEFMNIADQVIIQIAKEVGISESETRKMFKKFKKSTGSKK